MTSTTPISDPKPTGGKPMPAGDPDKDGGKPMPADQPTT